MRKQRTKQWAKFTFIQVYRAFWRFTDLAGLSSGRRGHTTGCEAKTVCMMGLSDVVLQNASSSCTRHKIKSLTCTAKAACWINGGFLRELNGQNLCPKLSSRLVTKARTPSGMHTEQPSRYVIFLRGTCSRISEQALHKSGTGLWPETSTKFTPFSNLTKNVQATVSPESDLRKRCKE
jgi:hypothetical protein